jgi:hypothetical protein
MSTIVFRRKPRGRIIHDHDPWSSATNVASKRKPKKKSNKRKAAAQGGGTKKRRAPRGNTETVQVEQGKGKKRALNVGTGTRCGLMRKSFKSGSWQGFPLDSFVKMMPRISSEDSAKIYGLMGKCEPKTKKTATKRTTKKHRKKKKTPIVFRGF